MKIRVHSTLCKYIDETFEGDLIDLYVAAYSFMREDEMFENITPRGVGSVENRLCTLIAWINNETMYRAKVYE